DGRWPHRVGRSRFAAWCQPGVCISSRSRSQATPRVWPNSGCTRSVMTSRKNAMVSASPSGESGNPDQTMRAIYMPNRRIYWLHTISPTHAGIGRGVGYIDLPIERDKVTGWPIIRGSSFKGVWRDWAVQQQSEHIELAFGRPDRDGESANSGALIPTDARLVCLPVRSFRGTFAWATS